MKASAPALCCACLDKITTKKRGENMKKQHYKTAIKNIKNCLDIDEIIQIVQDFARVKSVYFDELRIL